MAGRRMAVAAVGAIVAIWGGALVIGALEQRMPAPSQWLGHAGFHVWTAIVAAAVAIGARSAIRADGVSSRTRPVLVVAVAVGAFAAVTSLLDAVGAYPTLRAFHDAVNTVARPALWLLTTILVLVALVGVLPVTNGATPVPKTDRSYP
jgi:hypothetical protein